MAASAAKALEPFVKKMEKSPVKLKFTDPLDRLILLIFSDCGVPLADAEKAIKRLLSLFADYNEARVSRWVEIARALDPVPGSDRAAIRLRDMLNRLFDLRGELSLLFLQELKITEAKKVVSELDHDLPKEPQQVLLFQCVPGMTPPVSPEMVTIARKYELIGRNGTKEQLQKLLSSDDHENAAKILYLLEAEVLEAQTAAGVSTRSSSRISSRHRAAAKSAK